MIKRGVQNGFFKTSGFTIVESVVALGVVSFALVSLLSIFTIALRAVGQAKAKTAAVQIANEFIELYRNMPYDDVGTTTGWPAGAIPATQSIDRSGFRFTVATRIDYLDDPFDGNAAGTIQGKPVDTAPNDYKRADVRILLGTSQLTRVTTIIASQGLESASNTGSLLIQVFDSSGQPVPEANVLVFNSTTNPQVNISNTTDVEGNLQVLSLPPALDTYQISVWKNGYTSDGTERPRGQGNAYDPTKPDLSIIAGQVTSTSFAIDRVSSLTVKTVNEQCQAVADTAFRLRGKKLKGLNPDTPKYDQNHQTGSQGQSAINSLEWDTYDPTLQGGTQDVIGQNPPSLVIQPGSQQELTLVLGPKSPHSLLVTVNDAATNLPLTDTTVTISRNGEDASKVTGRGFYIQTDWSGGAGQQLWSDSTRYASDDGNTDPTTTAGELSLAKSLQAYSFEEEFAATSFRDDSTTTALWDGSGVVTLPQIGGAYTTSASAQTLRLNQANGWVTRATLTADEQLNGQTIRYFLSSDGGLNFVEVFPGIELTFATAGSDLRLRMDLTTTDTQVTPVISRASVSYELESYQPQGILESSTFDTGGPSTFQAILWDPVSQIAEVGADSVKLQIAVNNDNTTWNFTGPDGTASTFYTTSGTQMSQLLNDNRYLRYRVFLSTANPLYTPRVSSVAIGYTSSCTPPGQVFFPDLFNDTYTIEVSKTGYTTYSGTVDIQGNTSQIIPVTPSP